MLTPVKECAVAVSGGVDSMTLAVFLHRMTDIEVTVFHAASPAVPHDAAARVSRRAETGGWRLRVLNAGEFDDSGYVANPLNRCFYCKNRLYSAIRRETAAPVFSGTNTDDLNDFRPGLRAADEHSVRHPYAEAGMAKQDVRALAAALGCADLAELPASPCLSSRVETGVAIDAAALSAVDAAEADIRAALNPKTVRCRVRRAGVVVELDSAALARLNGDERARIAERVSQAFAGAAAGPVTFADYRMGSAFMHAAARD